MKPIAILSTLTLALAPAASAWRLQLYKDGGYVNRVEDRSGTLGQPCKNLPASYNDAVSSMKWDGGNLGIQCIIYLYNGANCVGQIGYSRGDWNIPQFPPDNNNKLSSYKIHC